MKKGIRQTFELDLAMKLREGSNSLLTDKESIIASFLIYDYSVNEIAQHLCRSRNTIKIHIRNMKKKCKCETQTKFGAILQSFIKNSPQGYIQDPTSKPN